MTNSQPDNTEDYYNRPPITINKNTNNITIRASQITSCRRQLAYYARNEPVTNPPSDIAINRMLAGVYLENVVLDYLKRTGWKDVKSFIEDYEEPIRLTIPLTDNITVTGTPDAHGLHPEYTDNKLSIIEVKTRGNAAWGMMEKLGTIGAFPSAIAQLALYRIGLLESELIHSQSTGVLASMNTDTKDVKLFIASDSNLQTSIDELRTRLTPLADTLLNNKDLPARDYNTTTDWQCKNCPFLATCSDNTSTPTNNPPQTTEKISKLDAINALHSYEKATSSKADNTTYDTDQNNAKSTLFNYLKGEELDRIELPGTVKDRKIRLITNTNSKVDLDKLSQLVTKEQFNDIVTTSNSEYIRIY